MGQGQIIRRPASPPFPHRKPILQEDVVDLAIAAFGAARNLNQRVNGTTQPFCLTITHEGQLTLTGDYSGPYSFDQVEIDVLKERPAQ